MSELARWLRQVRDAMQRRDYTSAAQGLEQAATLARRGRDRASEIRFLETLGAVYQRLGQPQPALRALDRALTVARLEGDTEHEESFLGSIGVILHELGYTPRALDYLKHAIKVAEQRGDLAGHGRWLSQLGLAYDDLGQFKQAVGLHAGSVRLARELQDQKELARRLDNLGNSFISIKDYASALIHLSEAADLYRAQGAWADVTQRLMVVGNLYCELARTAPEQMDQRVFYTIGIDYYQQGYVVAHEEIDRQNQAELLRNMGNVFMILGDYEQAIYRLIPASHHYLYLQQREQLAEVQRTLESAQVSRRRVRA